MHRCNVQAQLFKCFMLYELKDSSPDALLFHINGYTLHFTFRKFALISELKWRWRECTKVYIQQRRAKQVVASVLWRSQFQSLKNNLFRVFKTEFSNDDDSENFPNLYFIHNFIILEEPTSIKIYRKHFDLVELGRFVDYPWGNKAFEELTKNLHSKITTTSRYFKIHGFPLAM